MRTVLRYLALIVLALVPLCAAYALAGPASQPASAPVVAVDPSWLAANWQYVVGIILAGLLVALTKKTWREGLLGFVQGALEALKAKPQQPPSQK